MTRAMRMSSMAAVLACTAMGIAFAAELPREGSYDHTTCFTRISTRIDYSPTHFAYSHEDTGTSVSSPPGGLFDGETVRCVGMTASFDGKRSGSTVCEGVARNGDKRLTRFWYDSEGVYQREAVTGTGQYEGLITTGTVKAVGQTRQIKPGTTQYCNRGTGTYKLK